MEVAGVRAASTREVGPSGCAINEISRHSLRLDGDPVYVNAQALSVSHGRALLAGVPNYVWSTTGEGRKLEAVPESIFGVMVEPDGTVEAVPLPMRGHLNYPYAVARPDGGWWIVFMELAESIREEMSPKILGIWSGVFDGEEWTDLERLPMPEGYEVEDPDRGSLLRSGDTLAFAIIADPLGQVLLFERAGGGWSYERVTVSSSKRIPEPVTVSNLALVPWRHGFALLVNKNDATIDSIYNSLFLYARDGGWREHRVVTELERFVSTDFSVSVSPEVDVVSWVADNEVFAYMGSFEHRDLHALTVATAGVRNLTTLNSIISRVAPLGDGTPLWVMQHLAPDESGELRFLTATSDSATQVGTIDLPYLFARLQAASKSAPDEILLAVGHAWTQEADSLFASLLIHVRTACGASAL